MEVGLGAIAIAIVIKRRRARINPIDYKLLPDNACIGQPTTTVGDGWISPHGLILNGLRSETLRVGFRHAKRTR